MFKNRTDAGIMLAKKIIKKVPTQVGIPFRGKNNMIVLALTRGGVVVGRAISDFLDLPFDILVVKKIGAPANSELAIGAIGPKNSIYWNKDLCRDLGVTSKDKLELKKQKEKERREQEKVLRAGKKALDFKSKVVILVDDGVATGATVLAAYKFLKKEEAKKIVLAVPIISKYTLIDIKRYFDTVLTLKVKRDFMAVGQFYEYFPQVTNEEVIAILNSK